MMSNNKVLKNGIEVRANPARNELEDDVDSDSSGGSDIGEKNDNSSSKSELLVNLRVKSLIGKKSTNTSYKNEPAPVAVRAPGSDERERVKLERLGTQSLRRYCCHYQIDGISADSSREKMLNAVRRHFNSQPPLDELQVIADFSQAMKGRKLKSHGPKERGNTTL